MHAMVAFLYKLEVQAKEESQRAADVNPLVITPYLRQLRVCGVPVLAFEFLPLSPSHCAGWVCLLHSHQSKTIGVGRNGLFVSPSLRTGLADLPHPALKDVSCFRVSLLLLLSSSFFLP